MSSSTSSSREELRALVVLGLLLLAAEAGIRSAGGSLSLDLEHIGSIPAAAEELARGDELRVLFLGNSLIREGLDSDAFELAAESQGFGPLRIAHIYPDDTTIAEWPHVFKHFFVKPDLLPDVLVVCFALGHLEDTTPLYPELIGGLYSSLSDIPSIFQHDVIRLNDRVAFVLAQMSAVMTNRGRVAQRVLDTSIPYYREFSRTLNEAMREQVGAPDSPPTYERLERLTQLASSHGVRLVLAAMPVREPYELDPRLPRLAEGLGASFIDARSVPGLTTDMFQDNLHLTPMGARLYTRFLVHLLSHLLSPHASPR